MYVLYVLLLRLTDLFCFFPWMSLLLGGESPDSIPPAIQNYLANIRARMTNPLRTRVGGNSMDSSFYVPDQEQMIEVIDDSYYNDIPVHFGPMLFRVLNAMADAVGSMDFIISLSMQEHAQDDTDTNIVQMVSAALNALGDRLDAVIVGNVCNK